MESIVELGMRLNCLLPVIGTLLQESKRKDAVKNKLTWPIERLVITSPFQNAFLLSPRSLTEASNYYRFKYISVVSPSPFNAHVD